MIELLKPELEICLLTLNAVKNNGEQIGILNENISLGLKRKGQKIFDKVLVEYQQYQKDKEECKGKEEDLKELNSEVVKIDADKMSIALIEAITSSNNYDFKIIEKIAE